MHLHEKTTDQFSFLLKCYSILIFFARGNQTGSSSICLNARWPVGSSWYLPRVGAVLEMRSVQCTQGPVHTLLQRPSRARNDGYSDYKSPSRQSPGCVPSALAVPNQVFVVVNCIKPGKKSMRSRRNQASPTWRLPSPSLHLERDNGWPGAGKRSSTT